VHRDLKLENLMLMKDRSGEEMVKVLDFGIAKIAEREADSRLTTVGTLGTPGYAAPEQLRAESVDGRTDLFAFGVILYALLTGRDPWLGKVAYEPTDQIYELMVATDRAEVRPMAESGVEVPPAMAKVVLKLLRRDPAQRFQSARELRATLERLQVRKVGERMAWDAEAALQAGSPRRRRPARSAVPRARA
jgi:serine/threonine-protein kinase